MTAEPDHLQCLVASWDWSFGQKEATPKNNLGKTTFIFLWRKCIFSLLTVEEVRNLPKWGAKGILMCSPVSTDLYNIYVLLMIS